MHNRSLKSYMSVVSMLGSVKHRSRSRSGHGSRGMLPSYKKFYSRHMTHVLWVPLGVEFDCDIHFVIRVHVRSQKPKFTNTYTITLKSFRQNAKTRFKILENIDPRSKFQDSHLICQCLGHVMVFTACLYVKLVILHDFSNICPFWSKSEKS